MSYLHVWHSVPVNKSKRPFLTENEHHVYVKDGIGIYQGKSKIKNFQNGRVYITNKRIIYLDSADTSKAVAVDLSDTVDAEYIERFLRSSPKIKIHLKASADKSDVFDGNETSSSIGKLAQPQILDWVCGICSFNNHVSSEIDLSTDLPKCVSCGIPPSREQLESVLRSARGSTSDTNSSQSSDTSPDQCPKCTFINHPSMRFCEVCGAPLKQASKSILRKIKDSDRASLSASNPLGLVLEDKETYTSNSPYVKLSFRKGGDVECFRHVKELIEKIKWEALEAKGGVKPPSIRKLPSREPTPRVQSRGIQGLVKIGELQRKQNELILSSSLEGLEQLMHKAQEISELASSFSSIIKKPQLFPTTMAPFSVSQTSSIYHQELAQHMCEFLLNFKLTKFSSMITSQDFFASYNRFSVMSQGFGGELVTTQNFQKCLQLFETLNLPVKLKTYQSGLVVVTQRLQDSQDIHQVILEHLISEENRFLYEKFTSELLADSDGYMKDVYKSFRGKTVAEIAENFGWSSTICVEELARCVDEGLVVFDKHVSGTFYFVNKFDASLVQRIQDESLVKQRAKDDVLKQQTSISTNLKQEQESIQKLLALNEFGFGGEVSSDQVLVADGESKAVEPVSESLSLLSGLQF